MITAATRKQYGDLTLADFEPCPVWELALDEEDVEGQNEETVRPCLDHPDLAHAGDLVRAAFRTADGRILDGIVTAGPESDWSSWYPQVWTDGRWVLFWHGIVHPALESLADDLAALGGPEAFPIVAAPTASVDAHVPRSIVIPAITGLDRRRKPVAIAPRVGTSAWRRLLGRLDR